MGPLAGVRVVDLTHVLNGPFATMLLAHMGAEVIKIEPRAGDRFRYAWMPVDADHSGYEFLVVNANKKGVTLDLKDKRGRALLLELIKRSDVLVENFSLGVMERLRLGYETLHELHPRLIYASSTGYGEIGPYSDMRANATIVSAMTGWTDKAWSDAGVEGGVVSSIGDEAAGVSMALGICAALFERERSGKGQKIHVAMMEAHMGFMVSAFHSLIEGRPVGSKPKRCADGYVTFHLPHIPDKLWGKFVTAFGHPEMAKDPRFVTARERQENFQEMEAMIADWLRAKTRAEIWEALRIVKISGGPIRALSQVFEDEHFRKRKTFVDVVDSQARTLKMLAPWVHFSDTPTEIERTGPSIGEHNREVFQGLIGLDQSTFDELEEAGVI